MNSSTKLKETHSYKKHIFGCQGGSGGEGWEWEVGVSRGKLPCAVWINDKVLLFSTGDYIQDPVTSRNGKEYEKECIYAYIYI